MERTQIWCGMGWHWRQAWVKRVARFHFPTFPHNFSKQTGRDRRGTQTCACLGGAHPADAAVNALQAAYERDGVCVSCIMYMFMY
jgi:hypothetical protein